MTSTKFWYIIIIENIGRCVIIHRIKIKIRDNGKTINIPGIPFSLANVVLKIGLSIANNKKYVDDYDMPFTYSELKPILKELKKNAPFTMVDVQEKNGDGVLIKIL